MDNQITSQETRATQRARLLALLKANAPDWVPIREVVAIAGFQYGARVFELRRLGHRIENDPGRAFRLRPSPSLTAELVTPSSGSGSGPDRLFPDDTLPRHLDLG